jgi:hypothetical protein
MSLIRTYADGCQFWRCPDCGRLVTVDWRGPVVVINPGDETAYHDGIISPDGKQQIIHSGAPTDDSDDWQAGW